MDDAKEISDILDKYFDQIEVEDIDYVPWDDAVSDVAYLLLIVPTAMLQEYLRLKGQNKNLPDGAEFWKATNLRERLRHSNKYHGQGREPLGDILDFLGRDVQADYQELHDHGRIRLSIYEIPTEFHHS